jgi:hypothetical protein
MQLPSLTQRLLVMVGLDLPQVNANKGGFGERTPRSSRPASSPDAIYFFRPLG